jgi:hypothetical protein
MLYLIFTFPLSVICGMFMMTGCYLIFKDSLEGRYCPLHLMTHADEKRATKVMEPFTLKESLNFLVKLVFELATLTVPGLVFYGCIPLMMAAFSLSTVGHKFDYIVAAKPEGANGLKPGDAYNYKPVSTKVESIEDVEMNLDGSRRSSKERAGTAGTASGDVSESETALSTSAPVSQRNSLSGTSSIPVSSIGHPVSTAPSEA